ncbi:MAG: hypothetical protein ACLUI3_00785 [Christensenellales bacterium]
MEDGAHRRPTSLEACAARIREAGGCACPRDQPGSSGVGRAGLSAAGRSHDALEVSPAAPLIRMYRYRLPVSLTRTAWRRCEREFALEAKTRSVDAVFDAIAGRTQPD